mgnify:CR=1 FL=1
MTRFASAFIVLITLLLAPSSASADPNGGGSEDGFWVEKVDKKHKQKRIDQTRDGVQQPGPRIQRGRAGCPAGGLLAGLVSNVIFCPAREVYATPGTQEVVTVGLIRTAFAELKLPAGKLVIQPPDGLTLVNFDTNFYTTSTQPISRNVTLLGQSVTLEATPATFTWTFGDGQSMATDIPGRPYPKLDITHNYLRTGTYLPSLSTTYTGRFRVGNGPWRQIPGTVTIDGTGQSLRAIEAQPKLVGY